MLSVIIIAKNEQENIRKCLESVVTFAKEIIVLDSGSTDNTVAIAKEYTDHVYETDWQGYGVQKQRALSHATGEWVLNLDADEYVDAHLKQAIQEVVDANKVDGCRIPIRMSFYGKPLRFSSSPKRHIRLFRRKGAKYSDDIVHEKIIMPTGSRIIQLKTNIMHQSFHDVSHALYKINRYSSYSAKIKIHHNKKTGMLKSLMSSLWMFVRCYILQKGFLDGKAGFLLAVFNAQGAFYRGVKQIYQDSNMEQLPHLLD